MPMRLDSPVDTLLSISLNWQEVYRTNWWLPPDYEGRIKDLFVVPCGWTGVSSVALSRAMLVNEVVRSAPRDLGAWAF